MIIIDFEIDETELAESLAGDITQDDYVCFVSTMFIMPVKFQIDDYILFISSAPIMSLASDGLLTVKELKNTKKEYYSIIEGPGDIDFFMIDNINVKLDFHDSSNHTIKIVNYDELLKAFEKFAEKVRKFLWERVPQMNDHPYWGPWLRGERD